MTRINVVDPGELHVKHLVAEYRELPRVFGAVRRAVKAGKRPDDFNVPAYVLGTGHVRFFYTRLSYLARRQRQLVEEMRRRGYRPRYLKSLRTEFNDIPKEWWGDWHPTPEAIAINLARLQERAPKGPSSPSSSPSAPSL